MSLSKVLDLARADLGYTENPPGSNMTKYGKAYGMNGVPWCVESLWYWFNEAGERMAFFGGGKTARCSLLLEWYQKQGLTVPVSEVQVGDIVLLNFNGKGTPDHCGIVVDYSLRVSPKTGAPEFVVTIEGNTTPGLEGSQDNGGSVALKNRYFSNIVAVCRPMYEKEEPMPKDDIAGHWAQQSIQWAKDNHIMEGFPDGSFRPNDPVLRGEEATISYRLYELFMKELAELRKEIARLREEIRQIRGEDDLK